MTILAETAKQQRMVILPMKEMGMPLLEAGPYQLLFEPLMNTAAQATKQSGPIPALLPVKERHYHITTHSI